MLRRRGQGRCFYHLPIGVRLCGAALSRSDGCQESETMTYIPHTQADVEAMLKTIGVKRIEDLFAVVPLLVERLKAITRPA